MTIRRLIGFLLGTLVMSSAIAEPPVTPNGLVCDRSSHGESCLLAWNMAGTPRSFYRIQRFETQTQEWENHGPPYSDAYTVSEHPVPAGALYRVLACDDYARTINCVSSQVFWPLLRPSSSDEIPPFLTTKDGKRMRVDKSGNFHEQMDQFNVYRLVQYLDEIEDLASFPPMTPVTSDPDLYTNRQLTPDEVLYLGIHQNYENRRAMAIQQQDEEN